MAPSRREFLDRAIRLGALAAGASVSAGARATAPAADPFPLGVASGSPLPDGVILWTRILADPLDPVLSRERFDVRWEVAEDDGFSRTVLSGKAAALPERAHCVHVDARGLHPDRRYWYRFMLGDAVSPIGRTRTAPAPDQLLASLRFAFASCQHWEFGHYAAHRHIAAAAPDLIVFLGDYIYEWGPYDLAHPAAPRRGPASRTLDDYRARYAQYKSDPDLQAAHRVAPWIVTWDDHEVANDYAGERDESLSPDFPARRAAAYQAFYEHMPVRLPAAQRPDFRFASVPMHQRVDWGRLACFHVLDDRQHRSPQACPKAGRGGANSVTGRCGERNDAMRTMLGCAQETWLADGMASSGASWNVLAQQTLMAQCSQLPVDGPEGGRFWTDGWDGYPAARRRLFDAILRHRLANPLVISGDVHAFYAAELRPDFMRPPSRRNPTIATEFCGTSVTSNGQPQSRVDRYLRNNPHLKFGRSDRRGFVMMEVTPNAARARFQALDDVWSEASGVATIAAFEVESGRPGLRRTA
ncbi:MAG: alkaline phosphatase D family protein [Burkholderiaceae bacterium]